MEIINDIRIIRGIIIKNKSLNDLVGVKLKCGADLFKIRKLIPEKLFYVINQIFVYGGDYVEFEQGECNNIIELYYKATSSNNDVIDYFEYAKLDKNGGDLKIMMSGYIELETFINDKGEEFSLQQFHKKVKKEVVKKDKDQDLFVITKKGNTPGGFLTESGVQSAYYDSETVEDADQNIDAAKEWFHDYVGLKVKQ